MMLNKRLDYFNDYVTTRKWYDERGLLVPFHKVSPHRVQ